ncbi:hypothetical protein [Winslowiella arboricola]|nr:hypothetical protein [Winslowiella arboricola]MCU5775204.1 hypothetical protein [Winslowiella arboricola]
MKNKLLAHLTRHEIFYHGIRFASAAIVVLFLALVLEMVSK